MSIATRLQNVLDNATDEVTLYIETDGNTYDIKQINVSYDLNDDLVEVTLVADYD